MRKICQADVLLLLRDKKFFSCQNKEIVDCFYKMGYTGLNDSRISEIANGKKNGISDLNVDKFYECFFKVKLSKATDGQKTAWFDAIKTYVSKNKLEFDGWQGKEDDTIELYIHRMLEYGLTNISKKPDNSIPDDSNAGNSKENNSPVLRNQNFWEPDNFTGRTDLLDVMQRKLEETHTVVLSGLGGIGKTKLCEKFSTLQKSRYTQIQRIFCEENAQSFHEMIAKLVFENIDDKKWSEEERYSKKYELLKQADDSVLIIFDNVDKEPVDMNVFQDLRRNSKINIIITTRLSERFDDNITISVDALEIEDQISLFEKYYRKLKNEKEIDNVKQLLASIQGHTLMIILLASVIRKKGIPISKVLELWKNDSDSIKGISVKAKKDDNDIEGNLPDILNKIFKIGTLSPDQQKVLYYLVFLPTEGVSREFLLNYVMDKFTDPIDSLSTNGWISASVEYDNIKLHPVIKDILKVQMPRDFSENKYFFNQIHSAVFSEDAKEYSDDLCQLIQSITEIIRFNEKFYDDDMIKLLDMACFCYNHYKYKYCENLCLTALRIVDDYSDGIFKSDTLIKLFTQSGKVYQRIADYEKAICYFKKSIDCQKNTKSIELGKSYRRLGEVYRKASRYEEALEWDNKALEIFHDQHIDSDDVVIAEATNAIGVVYLNMAQKFPGEAHNYYLKALEYYQNALQLRLNVPDKTRDLAFSYHNIGSVYNKMGNYEEALKYHQQGLQIRLDNDLEQTDIAASYTWIGNDYLALNDMEKSKQNLEIALSIREKILGTDHPDYAWTLDSLFCWYKTIKDYKSALQTINRIIEIRMACLGKEHSYTILAIEKRNSLIHNMT